MPLLHKKPFIPNEFQLDLKESEEVFFCKLTREIFRDYDEFCERIILCNSLVWSCSLTGRSHLTYQEAVASEERVKRLLKRFPMELRIPVLYLASLCERRSLIELAEDVYLFVKDRYFIGETVEANLPDGSFGSCHILAVIPPTNEELENYEANNVKNGERYWPPATLYKYEVETMDEKELTISADQIFRKKTAYNKDKNRLYIKQFVHLDAGYWRLKESSNTKYGISRVKFDQIFCGNPPDMKQKTNPPLKKKNGTEKGKRQETLNKYFKQTNVRQSMSPRKSPKKGDIRGSRLPSKFSNQKRRRRTKKEMEDARNASKGISEAKRQAREKKLRLAEQLKERNKKMDDLECGDLKELPIPNAVETKIPIEYFGDVIMIMEFLESFKKILNVRDFFPHGVNLDIMERALLEEEVAGPLCDLIQLFLAGIFDLQDQESEEIRETDVKINPNLVLDRGDANTMKMLRKATASEAWVRQCHGANVSQLVLDTSTLSEILRLHLLTSGARKKDKVAKWRYQARGGYCNYDDPAIVLKLNKPHIIQHLGQASICELPIGDKIIVLNCLMNQILTYSAARDILEEGLTKVKQYRAELRGLNGAEAKRGREEAMRQKEQKTNEEGAEEDNSKSLRSNEGVKEKVQSEIAKALAQAQILPLGMDRAFRRFWVFQTLPGLFVERSNEGTFGTCLPKGTPNFSDDSDKILYVRKLFEEGGDKENFSEKKLQSLQVNSPSKKLLTENNDAKSPLVLRVAIRKGVVTIVCRLLVVLRSCDLNITSDRRKPVQTNKLRARDDRLRSREKSESFNPPLTCWGDPAICPVHGESMQHISWAFYYKEDEIEQLIESLSRRGVRERRLRLALIERKGDMIKTLYHCPIEKLNPALAKKSLNMEIRSKVVRKAMKVYEGANLNFPSGTPIEKVTERSLRDLILETEDKISLGGLGALKVYDRQVWRTAIQKKSYDKQCKKLTWGGKFAVKQQGSFNDSLKKEEDDLDKKDETDSRSSTPSIELNFPEALSNSLEPVTQRPVILDLASAILQVEQCIDHKYLKRPLGLDQKERDRQDLKMPTPALERWEVALMESTSFHQLFLHLTTLDNSILWAKSALNAFCRICRRGSDPENMLLCDTCNKGHHLYCLKPKLTKVPRGDWHCPQCQPKEKVATEKKKRRMFTEEDEEEEEPTCKTCDGSGPELSCNMCNIHLHLKCSVPPVRMVPKSSWTCHDCRVQNSLAQSKAAETKPEPKQQETAKTVVSEVNEDGSADDDDDDERARRDWRPVEWHGGDDTERSSRRRSSKAATAKISQFAKQLRSVSWEGENENRPELRESSRRRTRTRRTQEFSDNPQDLPLDNAALQEILDEIMHHKDAWPFLRPVTKAEVPDYHLIIKRPMDFATIKHKLNMLEYSKNSELFADAELLFNNCYKYNEEGSEVYRAGEKIEKMFEKLCRDRNLMVKDGGPPAKRGRTVL